jgi:DUF917 family protein
MTDHDQAGPRVTSKRENEYIVSQSKRNRRLTVPEIAIQLNNSRGKPISVTTVKERLLHAGLGGRVAVKKHFCVSKILKRG